jgi:hypothetical protein
LTHKKATGYVYNKYISRERERERKMHARESKHEQKDAPSLLNVVAAVG